MVISEIWDWMTDTSDETHKPLITEDGAVHDGFSEDDCTESASSPQW